jgi:hypothetical protein
MPGPAVTRQRRAGPLHSRRRGALRESRFAWRSLLSAALQTAHIHTRHRKWGFFGKNKFFFYPASPWEVERGFLQIFDNENTRRSVSFSLEAVAHDGNISIRKTDSSGRKDRGK